MGQAVSPAVAPAARETGRIVAAAVAVGLAKRGLAKPGELTVC